MGMQDRGGDYTLDPETGELVMVRCGGTTDVIHEVIKPAEKKKKKA